MLLVLFEYLLINISQGIDLGGEKQTTSFVLFKTTDLNKPYVGINSYVNESLL
jgi:uncharacterized membrane protein